MEGVVGVEGEDEVFVFKTIRNIVVCPAVSEGKRRVLGTES